MKLPAGPEPVMPAMPVEGDTGMPWLSPFDPTFLVLAGFRDCAEEALHFLTNVEQIPPSDPLFIGLRDFLEQKEKSLDVPMLLDEAQCPPPNLQPSDPLLHQSCLPPLPIMVSPGVNCVENDGGEVIQEGRSPVQFFPRDDFVAQTTIGEGGDVSSSLLSSISQCATQSSDSAIKCLAHELLALLEEEAMATDEEDDDCADEEELSFELNNSVEAVDQ